MRRIKYLFCGVILALFLTPVNNTFASAQDFYFEDFTADYYLTKLEDGTSRLHVKEVLTAVFPDTDQNHGITRDIPFKNQGDKNRVIENKDAMNLKVLRNGKPENINKIETNSGYYTIYIGSADEYVHGEQIYTLEYDYTDVITEFAVNGEEVVNVSGKKDVVKAFQELYWDTNGTAWKQEFGSLTANLHMQKEVYRNVNMDDTRCYVGSYGEKGEDRCTIEPIDDGISFRTVGLDIGENLTFAVDFKPGTFEVVLEENYILVVSLIIEIIIVSLIILRRILKWRKKAKLQYDLYKSLFNVPQYQPPEDSTIHVAEGDQIYMKKTKSSYVATLLELAVSKDVEIKKAGDGKGYDWSVLVNTDPDELSGSQKQVLNILAGNGNVKKGDEIPIEKHIATRYLANCAKDYEEKAGSVLEEGGYLVDARNIKIVKTAISNLILYFVFGFVVIVVANEELTGVLLAENAVLVGGEFLPFVMTIIFIITLAIVALINMNINKYSVYTEKGIRLVRYLEGLELYIKMAEADRLKFLQSVEGVDTSNQGIVKLYEKLLPWASLFGAEESWMKELSKYYEIEDVEEVINVDVLRGIIATDMMHSVDRSISSSTHYIEPSSGGGSSSWSSGGGGGGGGGSSGGGGGGGGGGGW